MLKKIIKTALSSMLTLSLLAACGGNTQQNNTNNDTSSQANTEEKVLVVGMASDLKTLDPGYMYEVFGNMYTYATYDMLFRIEGDGSAGPVPSLAESYELDETSNTYTFKLKQGVKFTSGNPLTSKDVVWSINRVRNLKSNTYSHVENIADVTATDDNTVAIKLNTADASFLAKISSNAFCILDSVLVTQNGGTDAADASSADKAKDYLDKNSAGSGPFKLVSWTPNSELVLEKNKDYWGKPAGVERIILKEIPDSNTQLQMLEKGDIDIAYSLNANNIKQLEGKADVSIIDGQTKIISFLMMNQDEAIGGPLSNPKVQQAVRYAIDYKGLQQLAGTGTSLPLDFVPQGFTGALNKPDDYQNIDKAKELMKEAGFEAGFETNIISATFDTEGLSWVTIAEKIKSDLEAIGINVKVNTAEVGVAIDQYREGKAPFIVMHWSPDYFDLNNQLAFLPGDVVGQRANWKAGSEPAMEELGKKIIGEADQDARKQMSEDLQNLMAENSPYAFLLQHSKKLATRTNIENVNFNDLSKIPLYDVTIK